MYKNIPASQKQINKNKKYKLKKLKNNQVLKQTKICLKNIKKYKT